MNQYSFTPKVIRCGDCGVEVLAEHNRKKFCTECAKRRAREGQQRHREWVRMKRRIERPEDPDRDLHYCDSPENVRKCLNCDKSACTNCLAHGTNARKKSKPYVMSDEVRERVVVLIKQGLSQKEIAEQCGVSQPTVSRWVAGLRWEDAL